MCSRQAFTAPNWTRVTVKVTKGNPRMSLPVWYMLVLFLCPSTKEMVVDKTRPTRWHSYQMEKGRNIIRNLKRHSEGTFASDFTHYLDKIKAKHFVEWLASTKRQGCQEELLCFAADMLNVDPALRHPAA